MSEVAKKVVRSILSLLMLVAAVMAYRSEVKARNALPEDKKGTIKEAMSLIFLFMLLSGGLFVYNILDIMLSRKESAKASYRFAYKGR